MKLRKTLLMLLVSITAISMLSGFTPQQDKAHEIADKARSLGVSENDPIILRAKELWHGDLEFTVMTDNNVATVTEPTARQATAHDIAEGARSLGLTEDDIIIVRAKEIWAEAETAKVYAVENDNVTAASANDGTTSVDYDSESTKNDAASTESSTEATEPDSAPSAEAFAIDENDVTMLAKLVYAEARGIKSQTEQACVIWTVLNRVDSDAHDFRNTNTIRAVVTAPYQFAYRSYKPTVDDYGRDLTELARDVLTRWYREKTGETDVGRVLPANYYFYNGSGGHNWFRTYNWTIWDYSLPSPYES